MYGGHHPDDPRPGPRSAERGRAPYPDYVQVRSGDIARVGFDGAKLLALVRYANLS
jgi:hypothetical protein